MTPEQRKAWMASRVTHGAYMDGIEKPEHYVWRTMLRRCNNPKATGYAYYGGKGITVCKRWLRYENFIADMGDRPSKDYSLDRIDTKKNYSPSNCRWATRSEQQKNKSTTKIYMNGKFRGTLVECAEYLGISKNCAYERWKNWGSLEKGTKWQQLKKG
jgi:hypothetical protein